MFIPAFTNPGTVVSFQKISNTAGDFTGVLDNDDLFGGSLDLLSDLDGDMVRDLAVGALIGERLWYSLP